MQPSVLLIDNHDSFTWNLAQLLEETRGCALSVLRYEAVTLELAATFDKIVFSPGPGLPSDIPLMKELLEAFGDSKSFLGVCLGFQAIVEAFGGKLYNLEIPSHGLRQEVRITKPSEAFFRNMPSSFHAGLYHSWAAEIKGIPADLEITAIGNSGTVMAVSHKNKPISGVQFHPESYMTEFGNVMMKNWLNVS